ncbi:MAG: dipeptide epimerase [Myxococcales bacterium]|nr:dipeptide epimerase [Myxococcales bacterium]MDH5565481.1 dipeptide epimerase [Myxococcales bacterium]
MKIAGVEWRSVHTPLTQPYEIASLVTDSVDLLYVRLRSDDGLEGWGSASPAEDVTGESPAACEAALARGAERLPGRDPRETAALSAALAEEIPRAPAARAAFDMACHDLAAQHAGRPLAEILGRVHERLPTSVTLGIQSVEESLAAAADYVAQGFRCLKVKIGKDLEADIERLVRLRETQGPCVALRVDANQGYDAEQTRRFFAATAALELEFVEQPMPASEDAALLALPAALRRQVALDESLHSPADARRLAGPPAAVGTFVVKLMKCGGPTPALEIAAAAAAGSVDLMWGCNDESVISIAAALHVAYACPATRYLDLDGSFDLARDLGRGGFRLVDGHLELTSEPGLGVTGTLSNS